MAKVVAPFFSLKAKGKFADTIQVQPKPYTKELYWEKVPDSYYKVTYISPKTQGGYVDFIGETLFPATLGMHKFCELDRIMKPVLKLQKPGWEVTGFEGYNYDWMRVSFADWAKEQHKIFKQLTQIQKELTEAQKTSWKVFGLEFKKQDLCTLAIIPISWAEQFKSMILLGSLAHLFDPPFPKWAPVAKTDPCWKADFEYYNMKKASLRRAWAFYRKGKYDIKRVMSVTTAWKKYSAWYTYVTEQSAAYWQYYMTNGFFPY